MKRYTTLFFGSPKFAVKILECLSKLDYIDLVGVVTQADKAFGRKQILKETEVSEYAMNNLKGIKIFKPSKLKLESNEILESTKPELIVVASYGKILPEVIINYPKFKCLNVHGSLLPKLRGAIPIQKAILLGLKETGVTLQVMKMEMDEGDILACKNLLIDNKDTSESLMLKASETGVSLIQDNLLKYLNGEIQAVPQNAKLATYCSLKEITYENGLIDWNKEGEEIERMVRAYYPDPICHTDEIKIKFVDDTDFKYILPSDTKIFNADIVEKDFNIPIGTGIIENKEIFIKTSSNFVKLNEIQIAGKNRIKAKEYINGLANIKI